MRSVQRRCAAAIVLGILVAPLTSADATVITRNGSQIVVNGTFDWATGNPDDLPVTRAQTDYEFSFSFQNSPWDPNFTPPDRFPPDLINTRTTGRGSVGAPNTRDVQDSAELSDIGRPPLLQVYDTLPGSVFFQDRENNRLNPQPLIGDKYMRVGFLDITFPLPDGLTGDRRYDFFLSFDEEYRQVTAVAAIMTARSVIRSINPSDPSQEIFAFATTGFTGADVLETPLEVTPVPLPAAAPLLASAVAALAFARHRRNRRETRS